MSRINWDRAKPRKPIEDSNLDTERLRRSDAMSEIASRYRRKGIKFAPKMSKAEMRELADMAIAARKPPPNAR